MTEALAFSAIIYLFVAFALAARAYFLEDIVDVHGRTIVLWPYYLLKLSWHIIVKNW